MKKIFYSVVILSALFLNINSVFAGTIDLEASLGDKISPGSLVYMSWDSAGIDSSKKLDLYLESSKNGFLYVIKRGLPLNGSYEWLVPNGTVTAYDYRLSLNTNDKGPSSSSNYTPEFGIYSNNNNTYYIADFSVGLSYEGAGGEGNIDVEFETSRPLNKEYYLSLNISCPQGLDIYGESPKTKCNSWVGVDDRDGEYNLEYKNNTDKELYINFVLDLYKNRTLVQRKFLGEYKIPAANKVYEKMDLSFSPDSIKNGDEMKISFNDIGADYYIVGASCKDGISVSGKARPDLCVEGEKISGGGKDVISIKNLYPTSNRNVNTSFQVEVSAFVKEKRIATDAESVEIIMIDKKIKHKDVDNDNFQNEFRKWGDIKFLNPKEGQRNPEKIKAGQPYTIKWENIVKAEWQDLHLYKYDSKPSNDYLSNGPNNVDIGTSILDLGTAYLGQEELRFNLPSYLEPGYYFFRYAGKAADDSSPAIEIIGEKNYVTTNENNDNGNTDMSKDQMIDLIGSLFGKNSDIYQIVVLLINLGIIK